MYEVPTMTDTGGGGGGGERDTGGQGGFSPHHFFIQLSFLDIFDNATFV